MIRANYHKLLVGSNFTRSNQLSSFRHTQLQLQYDTVCDLLFTYQCYLYYDEIIHSPISGVRSMLKDFSRIE